jgi:hypothetical protein
MVSLLRRFLEAASLDAGPSVPVRLFMLHCTINVKREFCTARCWILNNDCR